MKHKNYINIYSVFCLLLLFVNSFSSHGQAEVPLNKSLARLNSEINLLKNDSFLNHASWGICVLNVKTGKTLAEFNSHISLIPASTLKIITTGAAIAILGPDYKFETRLEYDGILDVENGILHGNLYIIGGGDPTLESAFFKTKNDSSLLVEKWANIIKEKGITTIDGAVIGDAGIFEDAMIPSDWIWGDIGNYYGIGACGLTFMDNMYTISFKSGKGINDSISILKITPEIPGMSITNFVKAGGNTDDAIIYGAPYSNLRYVTGSIPAGKTNFEVSGSMPDPAYFCAYSLDKALKNSGVNVSQIPSTIRELKLKPLVLKEHSEHKAIYNMPSPSLEKIVYWTNLKSNNLYAEHLLKTISFRKTGFGTDSGGIKAVMNFWKEKGIDTRGLYMADGCGLSRANTMTTRQQAEILRVLALEPNFNSFYNSLPVAGRSGSLSSLCKGSCAENNLRAKSGYINRARGYVGYVRDKKGEQLSFSLLINNYDCSATEVKKKMEKLLVLIAELE